MSRRLYTGAMFRWLVMLAVLYPLFYRLKWLEHCAQFLVQPFRAAFGEGKGDLTASLQVFSLERCGRGDLEHGDKILLPTVRANARQRDSGLRFVLPFPTIRRLRGVVFVG